MVQTKSISSRIVRDGVAQDVVEAITPHDSTIKPRVPDTSAKINIEQVKEIEENEVVNSSSDANIENSGDEVEV